MAFGFKQDISFQKVQIHEKLVQPGAFPKLLFFSATVFRNPCHSVSET